MPVGIMGNGQEWKYSAVRCCHDLGSESHPGRNERRAVCRQIQIPLEVTNPHAESVRWGVPVFLTNRTGDTGAGGGVCGEGTVFE